MRRDVPRIGGVPGGRNWTHAAGVIWPILVEAGRSRTTLTYEAVAAPIATNPLSVGYALGPIQTYCLENRLAPLTVVVVGKTTGVPGNGFIAWDADDLHSAHDAVQVQNWSLVGNPFAGFGPDEDEHTMARRLVDEPAASGDIYRQVRDRGVSQRIFRLALLAAYDGCAMCGLTFPAALEAAHILPWRHCSERERLDVRNGILLCASHHRLFDDDVFALSGGLEIGYYDPEATDGRYSPTDSSFALALHGTKLRPPRRAALRPDPEFVRRRNAL